MAANPSVSVAACPAQAEGKFVEAYAVHRADLLRWVIRNFGPRDAEEITDETLARAFAALPRLDLERPLQPWLRVVARRLAREIHEGRQRCDAWGDVYDTLEWQPSPYPDPEQEVELHERRTRLARLLAGALTGVSTGQRHVLLMRAVDELPFTEIASRLGSSEAAVRQQLTKACKRLRTTISAQGGWRPAVVGPMAAALRALRLRYRHAAHLRAMAETPSVALASIVCTGLVCVVGYAGLTGHSRGDDQRPSTSLSTRQTELSASSAQRAAATAVRQGHGPASQAETPRAASAANRLPAVQVARRVNTKPLTPGRQVEIDVATDLPVVGATGIGAAVDLQPNSTKHPPCPQVATCD